MPHLGKEKKQRKRKRKREDNRFWEFIIWEKLKQEFDESGKLKSFGKCSPNIASSLYEFLDDLLHESVANRAKS